ncbi:MAG: alpha/beta hydrolase [Crocinitomicaceae bacterium]|jgi:pimeloyl-ACP methyl ester carboxylesterase|nr:alpha/beta hydrolase [Crocinitomicaceae bacterium]
MKTPLFFACILLTLLSFGQTKIYCLPGQGADKRQFADLVFPEEYEVICLEYGTPEKNQSMHDFAKTLIPQIDTTEKFILLGVSLGGMLCVELNDFVNPEMTILISSAPTRLDLPSRYRFQKRFPLFKIVPKRMIRGGAMALQPIVEPDRKAKKELFKSMLKAKTPEYMKRTVAMIVQWDRTQTHANIIQIHGNKDHTLPLKNIQNAQIIIDGGSHMMVLTRAQQISFELNYLLTTP